MTTTAKPQPPRHRAAPRLIPQAVLFLASLLGVASVWVPRPFSTVMGATALVVCLSWFIQRWRRAGYDLDTGAAREMESR